MRRIVDPLPAETGPCRESPVTPLPMTLTLPSDEVMAPITAEPAAPTTRSMLAVRTMISPVAVNVPTAAEVKP